MPGAETAVGHPAVRAAARPHLVLGEPHGQRHQLYHLMSPDATATGAGEVGKRLLTMPTALWHHGHDLIHLFDRQ